MPRLRLYFYRSTNCLVENRSLGGESPACRQRRKSRTPGRRSWSEAGKVPEFQRGTRGREQPKGRVKSPEQRVWGAEWGLQDWKSEREPGGQASTKYPFCGFGFFYQPRFLLMGDSILFLTIRDAAAAGRLEPHCFKLRSSYVHRDTHHVECLLTVSGAG